MGKTIYKGRIIKWKNKYPVLGLDRIGVIWSNRNAAAKYLF
jgi:hypothetical protein